MTNNDDFLMELLILESLILHSLQKKKKIYFYNDKKENMFKIKTIHIYVVEIRPSVISLNGQFL